MRIAFCLTLAAAALPAAGESTHRLHDGVTALVHNADGRDFTLSVDVRDINIFESGPREVLLKVYDPDGKAVVRQVIPDDGVTTRAYRPPAGAWDHEAWYYAYVSMAGVEPMIRWSAFSAPDRLATIPKRTFTHKIAGGKPGVWRVLLVGCIDHYATIRIDPALPYAVAGHTDYLHGHGAMFKKSFVHVPRGATGLHVVLCEYDTPRTRRFTIRAPDGKAIYEGDAAAGFTRALITFAKPGEYDDQVLTVEVSEGAGDYLFLLKLRLPKDPEVTIRGERAVTAALAPDAATASAVRNGAIHHDGRMFWQPFQVRFHEWLKKLSADDFLVKDAAGKTVDPEKGLPERAGFIPLNGRYWKPPLSDRLMHHYVGHRNKAALNLALRDLAAGLRSIGPNDHVAIAMGGPWANMAYEFGAYAWHYWRPAWRILKDSDAPEEVKAIVREAFLLCGDRLAFCRTWERVNGNSFAQVLSALRYCSEATGDPLHKELFDTYWQRFVSGGWGERAGVGPSGPVQEGFGYDFHYASYITETWDSINADLKDERFIGVHNRIREWYTYTLAEEGIAASPWCSRTHHVPPFGPAKDGPFAWKGLPGPDFTTTVNGANEWFAARRPSYYVLTYHGRLTPKWMGHAFSGQIGFGGGALCQVHVVGRGPVITSTLNGDYGAGMHPSQWRNFHLHTVVGHTADGKPLVAADSEHTDAKLAGTTVTSAGEVRDSTVRASRSYTFGDAEIACEVKLAPTSNAELLGLWIPNPMRAQVTEAWEMIPFVKMNKPKPGGKRGPTEVTLVGADGKSVALTKEPATAKTVVIDRGGFGVRIELAEPRAVKRGDNDTVLIRLADAPTPAGKVELKYRLVPFAAP